MNAIVRKIKEEKLKKAHAFEADLYDDYKCYRREYYYLMREYNWLISEYNPVLKWATEELMKLYPNKKTVYGDTYQAVYEEEIKNAKKFNDIKLMEAFELLPIDISPVEIIIEDEFIENPVINFYSNDTLADYETICDEGVKLYTLKYLKNNYEELKRFYNKQESLKALDNFVNKSIDESYEELINYKTIGINQIEMMHSLVGSMMFQDDRNLKGMTERQICLLMKNEELKEKMFNELLERYWHYAIHVLKVAPIMIPIVEKAIKTVDAKLIEAIGCNAALSIYCLPFKNIEHHENLEQRIKYTKDVYSKKITKKVVRDLYEDLTFRPWMVKKNEEEKL